MEKFTKTNVWAEVEALLNEYPRAPKGLKQGLEDLLKPKTGSRGQNTIEVDGQTLYYCRYTDRYWPCEEMVFQNDEKRAKCQHKGYSKVGISLWTKARRAYEALKNQLTAKVVAGEDATELAQQVREMEEAKSWNDPDYLIRLADDAQRFAIENKSVAKA